jgi:PIN domain nuclease of toxin-antitoxin system
MKVLLDSHAFLWAISSHAKVSPRVRQIFTGPHDLLLSVVSMWEILIKTQIGKLRLPSAAGEYLLKQMARNHIEALPVNLDHVLRVESLPAHHRDPFDRLLIAQSLEEALPIVTADPVFSLYPVTTIW